MRDSGPRLALLAAVSLVIVAAAVAVGLAGGGQAEDRAAEPPARERRSPASGPRPGHRRRTLAEINRQDRVGRAHRRRETRAFERRPLLQRLPVVSQGVTIDIGGLAADGRTTVLTISIGPGSRRHAIGVYRRWLRRTRDTGEAYRARLVP